MHIDFPFDAEESNKENIILINLQNFSFFFNYFHVHTSNKNMMPKTPPNKSPTRITLSLSTVHTTITANPQ